MASPKANDPAQPTPETPETQAASAARKAAQAAAIVDRYAKSGAPRRPQAEEADSASDLDDLKLRELIDAAVAARGLRKPETKHAIEAALEVIGAALAEGRGLNLPGLGKLKIKRSKVANGRRVSELRLRQDTPTGGASKTRTERVAEDGEDG